MNREYDRRLIKFEKVDKMRFIGHLDLLRIFQGAIRRANLPIAYSSGFNPHQKMAFALPLPLGMQSTCEYLELFFEKNIPFNLFDLNDFLPSGLRILECYEISQKTPNPSGAVKAAEYNVIFDGMQNSAPYLQEILDSSQIIVLKKTKKSTKETDIRPDIFMLKYIETSLYMRISAGSSRNLNPMILANYILAKMGLTIFEHEISITRGNLFTTATTSEYSVDNSLLLWQIKDF
ncbi:MAG: TIGR03936 family radical SAM-associated protein [Firmicutes bacterium]|nr:TIGR03936 family radical SAM-associated protein [Bacillota bacterium]